MQEQRNFFKKFKKLLICLLIGVFVSILSGPVYPENSRKIILYDGGGDSMPMATYLVEKSWSVVRVDESETSLEKELNQGCNVLVINYQPNPQFGKCALSVDLFKEVIHKFLKEGGFILICGGYTLPLSEWFPGENLKLKWAGWELDPARKTTYLCRGDWLDEPNSIRTHFEGFSPPSGYLAESKGWKIMASLKYKDGSEVPYLLLQNVGKGLLVVTTAGMGYSGGYQVFGSSYGKEPGMLIENLYHLFLKEKSSENNSQAVNPKEK